jgi:hypothetical protein
MGRAENRHPPPERRRGKKRRRKKSENRTSLLQRLRIALQIGSVVTAIIRMFIHW